MPDGDPFESVTPEMEAAAAEYYATLAPPSWFYPLVGEVASEAVRMELYMTEAALLLTGSSANPREVISSNGRLLKAIDGVPEGSNSTFDELKPDFEVAREERNAIVHAILWWHEAEGPWSDFWAQHHPRSKQETLLPRDAAPASMTSALEHIQDVTQRAFALTNTLRDAGAGR